ncbi:30S ribosomal protein S16, partial [Polaribacter sp.]|nr:30S ribosomal protein S16 [Polaribacter sp.]
LQNGAQPTDTAKNLLSYKGAMLKNHLVGGVRKGALTQEQADAKFAAWVEEKATKISDKEAGLSQAQSDAKAAAFAAEKAVNEARIEAAKPVVEEVVAAVAVEEVVEAAPETIDEAQEKAAE